MDINLQSWLEMEEEFRQNASVWFAHNLRIAEHFHNVSSVQRYSRLVDASGSADAFEQEWKRSIGDVTRNYDIAKELQEVSKRFRKPTRLINYAMKNSRAELRHGPKLLRNSSNEDYYDNGIDILWTAIDSDLVIDHAFYALYVPWKPNAKILVPDDRWKLLRALQVDEDILRVISPRQFEEFIAYVYECFGCRVELTAFSRDFGADILAWHGGPLDSEVLIAVQVKRYAPHRKVGLKGIFELNGAIAHYHADVGHLVTSSGFTKPARDFAKKQRIHLVDMENLYKEINGLFQ